MIADEILTYAGFLKNNLKSFIDFFSKGIQTLADTVFDSANDNSHQLLTIPPEFYSTVYNENRAYMFTDRFNAYADGQGMQPFLYACLVKLENGNLDFIDYTMISRDVSGWWSYLNDSEISELLTIESEHNYNLHSFNDYPDNSIVQYFGNDDNFYFKPQGYTASDAGYEFTGYYGGNYGVHKMSSCSINFISGDFVKSGNMVDFSFSLPGISGGGFRALYKQPFILVTDDYDAVDYYITENDAVNNYSDTINTGDGDSFTIYYGDNYIIYYIPSGNKLSYSDIQLNTQNVINTILTDNPTMTPFTFPTYEENKHGGGGGVDEPDKDGEIDMPTIYMSTDTGYTHYYEFAKSDIFKVREGVSDLNNAVTTLKDVLRNLISYKIFAIPSTTLIKTKTPVIFHLAGRDIEYNGNTIPCDSIEELNEIDLGSIDVPKTFMDYRDYSPYTKLEIFVPFCGWTTIPSWCMGKTITGKMFVDLMNGSCKAVIKASKTVICEMGGSCSYDVPFAAENAGAKAAAVISKVATTAGAVASGNGLAIAQSGLSLVSALNANYTEMRGVCGDGSMINGLTKMYLKVTRVTCTDNNNTLRPDAYRHERGLPCGKELELYENMGYTQILDANVTGNMTAREKQLISDGFRHGLIL